MKIDLIGGSKFEQVKDKCKDEFFVTKTSRDTFSQLNSTSESWTIQLTHTDLHKESCALLATHLDLPDFIELADYKEYFPKFDNKTSSIFLCQFDEDLNTVNSRRYGHLFNQDFN